MLEFRLQPVAFSLRPLADGRRGEIGRQRVDAKDGKPAEILHPEDSQDTRFANSFPSVFQSGEEKNLVKGVQANAASPIPVAAQSDPFEPERATALSEPGTPATRRPNRSGARQDRVERGPTRTVRPGSAYQRTLSRHRDSRLTTSPCCTVQWLARCRLENGVPRPEPVRPRLPRAHDENGGVPVTTSRSSSRSVQVT
jgi:hypothetical protein